MNDSQRINYILDFYNLTPSELSRKMGLKRPQTIYDIQSGKTGISKVNAELICNTFPELNIEWISFGKGTPMAILGSNANSRKRISNNIIHRSPETSIISESNASYRKDSLAELEETKQQLREMQKMLNEKNEEIIKLNREIVELYRNKNV